MRRSLLAALSASVIAGAFSTPVNAEPLKSWVVYCEGYERGQPVAYVTRTVWQHVDEKAYRAETARKAMQALSSPIGGCSSVPFYNDDRAEASQRDIIHANSLTGVPVHRFEIDDSLAARDRDIASTVSARSGSGFKLSELLMNW